MEHYLQQAYEELELWQQSVRKKPSITNKLTRSMQHRVNRLIPEQIHQVVTAAIKQMVRTVIFGANLTTPSYQKAESLEVLENNVRKKIKFYRSSAAIEGGVTGAGGFLWGLADFPLWLSLKMKMMHEIAAIYGMDLSDYKERVYLLHIFQLTFSSQQHRNQIYHIMEAWEHQKDVLPEDINQFDWRSFQLEYRDYIDLAKLFQMIPLIGAGVGAFVNHRLTNKLGLYAMNAYRMRVLTDYVSE